MTKIHDPSIVYRQYDAAFARVAAYVVLKNGELVAKVAIKRSASNLRASAFVHWIGVPLVCGTANGGGYDKDSAAVACAARKIHDPGLIENRDAANYGNWQAFVKAASLDGGKRWDDAVRDAGFTVLQAV